MTGPDIFALLAGLAILATIMCFAVTILLDTCGEENRHKAVVITIAFWDAVAGDKQCK